MDNRKQDGELAERDAEATDSETLKDIEEAFGVDENTPEDQLNVPSPDGSFDEEKELDETEPS